VGGVRHLSDEQLQAVVRAVANRGYGALKEASR
jgi:hypothetical protein